MTAPLKMSRVRRHTLVYGVGIVVGKVISIVMLPFYTRYLTPADYGVMQLVDMTLDIVAIFAGTRIASGVFRFYHKAQDEADRLSVLSTASVLLIVSFGFFATATGVAAPAVSRLVFGSPAQTTLIRLAAASLGVQALVGVPLALLRLEERSVRFTVFSTSKLLLQVTLNVLFLAVFRLGVKGIFISTLVANVALALAVGAPFFVRSGLRFSRLWARALMRYGVPLMGTQIATFVVTFGDRYFLRVASNVTEVGLYSLAYQFGFMVSALGFEPFATMWEPTRFEIATRPDRDELYARAFVYMNLLLLTVTLGIGLFVGDFIHVMVAPSYFRAEALVPIILVAYVLQSWAQFFEVGVLIRERTELIALVNWLSAGAALLGYALLIPRWHGLGAAIATAVAFAVRQIATQIASQHLLPIRYQWRPVWRLVAAAATVYAVSLLLPRLPIWESIVLHSMLVCGYGLLVWFTGVIHPDDRERLRVFVGTAMRRLR
jgi:O-antigen/teichoic acid export membrane protein